MASKSEGGESAAEFLGRQGRLFDQGFSFSGYERDLVAVNRGDATYLDISGVSGLDSIGDGRAAVRADLDNDGDLDVFLRSMHGPAHLLHRNEVGQDAGWVRVDLRGRLPTADGPGSGPDAFGAVVRLGTSAGTLTKTRAGGEGFLAQSDPRLLFGLGDDDAAEWLEVAWPSGLRQRFAGPSAGTSWLVVEGEPAPRPVQEARFRLPDPETPEARTWAATRLRRGAPLPELHLTPLASGAQDVGGLLEAEDVPVVVAFWATWCVPCRRELPELQRLSASGARVVGLSVDGPGSERRAARYLDELGVRFPSALVDEESLGRIYAGGVTVPLTVILAPGGTVDAVFAGWSPAARRRLASRDGRPPSSER